jgi:hypothetical protein
MTHAPHNQHTILSAEKVCCISLPRGSLGVSKSIQLESKVLIPGIEEHKIQNVKPS